MTTVSDLKHLLLLKDVATRPTIARIGAYVGQQVTLQGWVFNRRDSKHVVFLEIRDGSGIMQAVVARDVVGDEKFDAAHLPQESSLSITGTVTAHPKQQGVFELQATDFLVVQTPTEEYPISPKEHGVDFLMGQRHLWLRSKKQWAILRVRGVVVRAVHDFFHSQGFVQMDSPILTPAACEGTTTLFETQYFDKGPAYLTQSGQLYGEASAMAFGKVYVFGPTFRAEKSATRRHLTEFWMVEPEVAFMDLEGDMQLAERFVSYVVARCLEECQTELEILERDTTILQNCTPPFPRISYNDCVDKLNGDLGEPIEWGTDFGAPHETALTKGLDKPCIVHRFPQVFKAFYMEPDPVDPRLCLSMDVLAPEGYGEIIGGSERIADYDLLRQRLHEHGLPEEAFEWYLDLRKYGGVPHAGFGMGIERCVAWITGTHHIRQTIPFPRTIDRVYP
ncbi:MAG: asparagine--tRNA ligase [bacterium]